MLVLVAGRQEMRSNISSTFYTIVKSSLIQMIHDNGKNNGYIFFEFNDRTQDIKNIKVYTYQNNLSNASIIPIIFSPVA